MVELDRRYREIGIAEMKEAELEPPLIIAFEAVLGRHFEDQRSHSIAELVGGEVGPALLKPAEHDHLDPEHGLRRHARRADAAMEL